MFNCSPILLRHLPAKLAAAAPVMVGPRAKSSNQPVPLPPLQGDPWAGKTLPPSRHVEGPVETRLSQQDDKIAKLQSSLEKVVASQQSMEQETNKRFEEQAEREKSNMQQVATAMTSLQKEIDQSLQKVAQQNAQVMDSRLSELKQLLLQKPKRALSPPEDEMQG